MTKKKNQTNKAEARAELEPNPLTETEDLFKTLSDGALECVYKAFGGFGKASARFGGFCGLVSEIRGLKAVAARIHPFPGTLGDIRATLVARRCATAARLGRVQHIVTAKLGKHLTGSDFTELEIDRIVSLVFFMEP